MSEYEERGYYEVQLNNKQLVFFFMSAVAIAVVVFLCGVMVGRGGKEMPLATGSPVARGTTGSPAEDAALRTEVRRELDFQERLESSQVPLSDDTLGTASAPENRGAVASAAKPAIQSPGPAPLPERPTLPTKASGKPEVSPGGAGPAYAVQVVALKTSDSAESLVGKLKTKGYSAYVEPGDSSGLYRVRVGRFVERDEAERIASRLRDEEKFKPYVIQ